MENKKFHRRKNVLSILLLLCFALSMTVASASAADNSNGYNDGYKKGYEAESVIPLKVRKRKKIKGKYRKQLYLTFDKIGSVEIIQILSLPKTYIKL